MQPVFISIDSIITHMALVERSDHLRFYYSDEAGYITYAEILADGSFNRITERKRHDEEVTAFIASPDKQTFASADANGKVLLWDQDLCNVRYTAGDYPIKVVGLAFYNNGQQLVVGRQDGYIQFYDTKTLSLLSGRHQGSKSLIGQPVIRTGHLDSFALSPNDRLLVTASGTDMNGSLMDCIEFWDPANRQKIIARSNNRPLRIREEYRSTIMAFHPDSSTWVSGGYDGIVRFYYRNGESRGWLAEQPGAITALAFSPRGKYLATGYTRYITEEEEDGEDENSTHVTIWHTDRQTVAWRLDPQEGGVTALAFTPDGQQLFVARESDTLEIHSLNL